LLDECLPLDFRHSFSRHNAHLAQWAGFKGKQNGELLILHDLAPERVGEASGLPGSRNKVLA
jgi:hypothetical protein